MAQPPGYESLVLAALLGFAVKVGWDWAVSGRVKKEPPYVLLKDCESHRERCCITQTKKDVAEVKVRVAAAEKRLDEGREDFRAMRKDIGSMKTDIAGMKSTLEQVRKFVMKQGEGG